MPEHLKALVVILVLASAVFVFVRPAAIALAMNAGDFARRRNLWFAVTAAVFLAHNFWLFMISAAAILYWADRRENNKMALFYFLLFAVPAIGSEFTGLGIIQHFFYINWLRLLALVILLPAWLALRRESEIPAFGSLTADRFLFGYLFVALALQLTIDTFTNTLRFTFYAFIDVFLPYYVASRSLRDLVRMREALMAFVIAAMLMVPVAVFEFGKAWLLYGNLNNVLGVAVSAVGNYLERGDFLRAMASVQHPIVLGYVMVVAMGLFLFLQRSIPSRLLWVTGLVALVVGLLAPLSRGPWLGFVLVVIVFVASGKRAFANLAKLGLAGSVALLALFMSPLDEKIIRYLPFVGDIEVENIDYRQRLIEIAVQLIIDNPWFGAFDYVYSPAIQELKQGQGIIDIVNSYVAIGLSNGLVGLSMFVLFFFFALRGVFLGIWRQKDKESELHLLGQALLACLVGILFMIFSVSGISVIPIVYWSFGGMCVAYASIAAAKKKPSVVKAKSVVRTAPNMAGGRDFAAGLRAHR